MKRVFAYILLLGGLAALMTGIYQFSMKFMAEKNARERAEEALLKMREILPERTEGSIYNDGSQAQMPVIEINGLSLVGYIETDDNAFVVQNEWGDPAVSKMKEGNIIQGTGVIETDQISFDSISEGQTITFTDINGVVYSFLIDYIGNENDIVQNAKLILFDEGMSRVIQIACIEN